MLTDWISSSEQTCLNNVLKRIVGERNWGNLQQAESTSSSKWKAAAVTLLLDS